MIPSGFRLRLRLLLLASIAAAAFSEDAVTASFCLDDARELRSESAEFPQGRASEPMGRYREFYGLGFPDAEHRWGFIDSGGVRLFVQGFEPEQSAGTLLFIHGYMDHSACQAPLMEDALSRGWAVYLMDLPGHGLSDGTPCDIGDFEEYGAAAKAFLEAVQRESKNPDRLVAAAHSTGCSAWLSAFRDGEGPFERAIFGGPLIRSAQWSWSKLGMFLGGAFIRDLPRGPHMSPELIPYPFTADPLAPRRFPVHWVRSLYEWNERNGAYASFPGPLTVIQGDRDTVVDRNYNLRYLGKRVADIEVLMVKGGTHIVFRYSGALREPIETVLDAYLGKRLGP